MRSRALRLSTGQRAGIAPPMVPFLTATAAQRYEQELLGLFQVRRCTETLDPRRHSSGLHLWRNESVLAALPVRRQPR